MKIFTNLLTILLVFSSFLLSAQQGTLRGTVYDEGNGMTIPFATILVSETGSGTTTDLDGAFELSLDPGSYTLVFSFLGYADFTVSDVVFTADKVEVLDVKMSEEGQVMDEIVVTAKQVRTSEAALATIKRKSTKLLDGVSKQTFAKTGDSNAGEALKRVTGVSVVGGKHVYVRGLGDRYTKTTLNGMEIPGLDPDRNSFEMDLIPTNLIDNIIVYKSCAPDLPGDFTGGIVDVVTKDFPEERYLSVSGSLGFNPDMHFNPNFVGQEKSGTDWLGMDNGLRANPIVSGSKIPNPAVGNPVTNTYSSFFQDNAGVERRTNNLNKSFSLATGNQMKVGENKYSYTLALNYKAGSKFYENAEFNSFIYDEQNYPGQFRLINDREIKGSLGEENVLWSAMAGLGYKRNNNKFSLQAIRLQNGTSRSAFQTAAKSQSSSALLQREILEYSQREVTNINITGKHVSDNNKLTISWKASPTFIEVDEPDIRFAAFEKTDEGFRLAPAVGADVSRTWRNLKESNISGKIDIDYNLKGSDSKLSNKLKFGALVSQKNRDFGIQNYLFRALNQSDLGLQGSASNIFNEENIWTSESKTGVYARGAFEPANTFEAEQRLFAAYAMNEISITQKLKAIYGARVEKADNLYTGQNNSGTIKYDNEKVLDELNVLPSANFVYTIGEKSNLRVSYNKTVARPSFKEKSIAQIQDRITGRTFLGNIDLEQSDIDNIDLRYETYGMGGQTFSVSGFYKYFRNPIELESFSESAPNNFQPKNIAESASVYGVEMELTRRLGFFGESFKKFTAGMNLTYVHSEVERNNAEDLPTEERFRPMVGQSPYIVNGSLNYRSIESGLEVNASYNVQGKSLFIAGFGSSSDVFTQPFHSLNMKATKRLGTSNMYKVSFSISNILGDSRDKLYEAFSGDTGVFKSLEIGRTYSVGFSANLK